MVFLYNSISLFVVVACVIGIYKAKKPNWKIGFGCFLLAFIVLYPKIQPSYMPKGEIKRSDIQFTEPSSAVIEDRNRKPVPSEERQAKQDEEYRKGAPSSER